MMVKGLPLDSFSCLDYSFLLRSVEFFACMFYQLFIITVHILFQSIFNNLSNDIRLAIED